MQRLKEDIRQKIIEVGKSRFQKVGYENTSMKEIASDVGISIGNIYRYFLTKKHLLNEILGEIEAEIQDFFDKVPSNYQEINMQKMFAMIRELTVTFAQEKNDTLKVLFNSQNETQFTEFKEKVIRIFMEKMTTIAKSINSEKEISAVLCEAIARGEFEGFTCIVKNDIDDLSKLKEDLEIYETLMIENLGERVLEVMKK